MKVPVPTSSLATPTGDQLDLLADALGDPTRRAIFKYVADADEPVTAADVGATFGVHRTVARSHLEKLTDTGLLVTDFLHKPEGGRPPKVYSRSETRLDLQEPVRQYQVLAELLLHTLERFGDAGEVLVREIGRDFGRRLASSVEDTGDIAERLAPLSQAGADMRVEVDGDQVTVHTGNCLFREVATRRPRLVCLLDQAIVTGLLSSGDTPYILAASKRRGQGHDACSLVFEAAQNGPAADDGPTTHPITDTDTKYAQGAEQTSRKTDGDTDGTAHDTEVGA
ncbi:MAG: helix-turn-helix transcriptional regulator [Thermoleophilia bacterium]